MKLYSILLVYKLLFTQAPIPVCLDGTIIDISTILVTTPVVYITTTMCDGVLHCLVFNVFLVSLLLLLSSH